MKVIGLTGSIATGKSTIVEWINELGIPTHDSDCSVHELLGPNGGAVKDVLENLGLILHNCWWYQPKVTG